MKIRFARLLATVVVALLASASTTPAAPPIDHVVRQTEPQRGILVHLGGDASRSLRLAGGERFVVQSLVDSDAKRDRFRKIIGDHARYGDVSVNRFHGTTLPFADNLINVLVVDDALGVSREEMLRVIRPLGSLWIASDDQWQRFDKPWPESMDDWTHFLHDASGNAVSKDKQVGPPRQMQWTAGPLWTRSHEFNNSMPAMVSSRGKMFYIFDFGLTGMEDERLPEKWTLLARDAFNGSLLWQRPLSTWGSDKWTSRALRFFKGNMARRLVAEDDHVFVTFEFGRGVQILDANTGHTIGEVPGTEGAEEILVDGNQLICIGQQQARRSDAHVVFTCYDIQGEQVLWRYQGEGYFVPQLTCVGRDAVVYHTRKQVVCLNRDDGEVRWTFDAGPSAGGAGQMLLVADDKVMVASATQLTALSLDDGETLWSNRRSSSKKTMREYDMFVTQGKVFVNSDGNLIAGFDLETGEPSAEIDPTNVQSEGHHLRCYRAKATEDFLITQFRGVEFLSLDQDSPHNQNDWLRGSCTYGVMPANGFLYQPPHSCFCFAGAMQKGLNAFASPADGQPVELVDQPGPIERGPAYGFSEKSPHASGVDWPSYRHDATRSGATTNSVAGSMQRLWKASFDTPITPPVYASGRAYVAEKQRHTIHSIDGATGKTLWSFLAGGPIDSPPSFHRGLLVFGCADGYVYCVRATDGVLAWRRRLAPEEKWMVDHGRLESVWRLHGSVPVVGDLAYTIAGRSSFVDGGLFLTAIDVKTGDIKHRTNLYTASNEREDRKRNDFVAAYHIEGAHSDLLVAQGGYVYLNQMKLSPELELYPSPYLSKEEITARESINLDNKDYVNDEIFKVKWKNTTYDSYDKLAGILVDEDETVGERDLGLHMFTTSGFLDTSFFNRTYWMYSKTWPGFNMTNLAPKSGQLVVVGPEKTYALKAFTERYPLSPSYTPGTKGYLVIADDNDNEPTMDPRAWGKDKGMGFSRGAPPIWHHWVPVRVNSMVLGGDQLYLCGPPDILKEDDPMAAFEGRLGSELWTLSAKDGSIIAKQDLDEMPIFDGMIVADDRLFLSTENGDLMCMGGE